MDIYTVSKYQDTTFYNCINCGECSEEPFEVCGICGLKKGDDIEQIIRIVPATESTEYNFECMGCHKKMVSLGEVIAHPMHCKKLKEKRAKEEKDCTKTICGKCGKTFTKTDNKWICLKCQGKEIEFFKKEYIKRDKVVEMLKHLPKIIVNKPSKFIEVAPIKIQVAVISDIEELKDKILEGSN